MIARETIYAALFGLLSGSASFKVASRRLRHWDDVKTAEQPALFMVQEGEDAVSPSTTLPAKFVMRIGIYIYAQEPDHNKAPSSVLNPLVDAVLTALQQISGLDRQTLGGDVTSCQVDGKIVYDEGVLGNQAVAIIPVKLIVAGG